MPVFLLAALLLLAVSGCHREAPEQALRRTVASMQAAAVAHDMDALFTPIADDFAGSEGMDRKMFRRYVSLMSMQNQKLGVSLGPLEVKLFDQRATVSFTAALSGGAGWLPEHGQIYQVDTGWRLEGQQWKLISAKWKPQL